MGPAQLYAIVSITNSSHLILQYLHSQYRSCHVEQYDATHAALLEDIERSNSQLLTTVMHHLDKVECHFWARETSTDCYSDILIEREVLMQKYIHLVQIVETEKIAANQLRHQLEDQDTEIERLKSEIVALNKTKERMRPYQGNQEDEDPDIKKIKKIPRYIITLHELLAHTPHEHVERKSLEFAKSKLEELSRVMHDEVSDTENIRKNLAIERMIVEGCDILLDTSQTFIRQGAMKNSSTIIVKHPWENSVHTDWTIIFNGPEIICSSTENRSVWPIDVAISDDANIQTKTQEKLEVLEALSNGGEIPLVATSDKPQSAPAALGSLQEAQVGAVVEQKVPTLQGMMPQALPPVVQSSSSPDEAVAGPSCASPLDDFKEHQSLLRWVAANLALEVEEMAVQLDTLINVLSTSTLACVALPVHKEILNIVIAHWQTPSSIPPTSKRAKKKYFIPTNRFEYLYTHLPPGSLVMSAANEKDRQGPANSTPKNKETKRLDLFGRKIYSTVSLQFQTGGVLSLIECTLIEEPDVSDDDLKGSGQVFGHLDFKIVVEPTDAPPYTVVLLAPSRQEKAAWTSDISQCIDNIRCNGLMTIVFEENSKVTVPHMIKSDARLHRDDIDICFSKTLNSCKVPQIRYASVERLLERLTDLRFLSIDFLNTFLHTYRIFTTATVVLEKLSDIYKRPFTSIPVRSLELFFATSQNNRGEHLADGKSPHLCRKFSSPPPLSLSRTSSPVRTRKLSLTNSPLNSRIGALDLSTSSVASSPTSTYSPATSPPPTASKVPLDLSKGPSSPEQNPGSIEENLENPRIDLCNKLRRSIRRAVLESVSVDRTIPESTSTVETPELSPCRSPSTPRHLRYRQPGVQTADNSHCSVSPASAFAIATAAAGHGSPPGENNLMQEKCRWVSTDATLRSQLSTLSPSERLQRIRKRPCRSKEDMLHEVMQHSLNEN
ncbi:Ras-specific guanine nucleotide-releasing factor 2 [Chelonia mydas]|uniref:Ras-specific guanine nucleotide-releasing factor 2 n=1 Tax=Chelonia mydas TaxID=8469 RepID=M7AVM2_CHEMY|nr:Ras-specific guanine nucleotide-releasing factor 2 [Chelonia mydas]